MIEDLVAETAAMNGYRDYHYLQCGFVESGILPITFSNPGRMNSVTEGQHAELARIFRDIDGDATFRIVEPESADAVADRVSALSPLGSALLGRRAGDEVRFRAPGGVLVATVVAVEPARGEGPGDRVDP